MSTPMITTLTEALELEARAVEARRLAQQPCTHLVAPVAAVASGLPCGDCAQKKQEAEALVLHAMDVLSNVRRRVEVLRAMALMQAAERLLQEHLEQLPQELLAHAVRLLPLGITWREMMHGARQRLVREWGIDDQRLTDQAARQIVEVGIGMQLR